jgi:hypothetical protein
MIALVEGIVFILIAFVLVALVGKAVNEFIDDKFE